MRIDEIATGRRYEVREVGVGTVLEVGIPHTSRHYQRSGATILAKDGVVLDVDGKRQTVKAADVLRAWNAPKRTRSRSATPASTSNSTPASTNGQPAEPQAPLFPEMEKQEPIAGPFHVIQVPFDRLAAVVAALAGDDQPS